MTRRAALYLRISQDRSGEGLGVERQEADCRRLADNLGWHVERVFIDNDVSAYSGKVRPAYDAMVNGIREGRFDAIIAYRSDRLYRKMTQLEALVDLVKDHGIEIRTVASGNVDLSTADGRMVARLIGAGAQGESDRMAERIRREKLARAEAGLPNGGPRPFGYQRDLVTVNPAEASVIREAASRVLSGETVMAVMRDFNRRGVTTSTGGPWTHSALGKILVGARWAGLRKHGAALTPAQWPAILTMEEHDLLVVKLAPTKRTRPVRRHLLTGLVRCTRCGGKMDGHLRGGNPEYRCPGEHRLGSGCRRRIRGDIEQDVVDRIFLILGRDLDYFLPKPGQSPRVDMSEMRQRLDFLASQFASGVIGRSEWESARSSVRKVMEAAEKANATQAEESPLEVLRRKTGDLREIWNTLALTQKRAILQAVIERIEVGPGRAGFSQYDPSRVTVITKPVRVSRPEAAAVPLEGDWIWDEARGAFAHEGVRVARSLPPLSLGKDSTIQRMIAADPDDEPEAAAPPGRSPRFRRGVDAARRSGEHDKSSG